MPRKWLLMIAAVAAVVALMVVVVLRANETPRSNAPAADSYAVHLQVSPAEATISLDGKPVGNGTVSLTLAKDGASHRVVYSHPGWHAREVTFRDVAPPVAVVELERVAEPNAPTVEPPANPSAPNSAPKPFVVPRRSSPSSTPPKSSTDREPRSPPDPPPSWSVPKPNDNKDPWKD